MVVKLFVRKVLEQTGAFICLSYHFREYTLTPFANSSVCCEKPFTNTNKTDKALKCNTEERLFKHCCCVKAINKTFCECVCSLWYAAVNAHASYRAPPRLYDIFPHYLINGIIFRGGGEKLLSTKRVIFSLQVLSKTFLIASRILRDLIKRLHRTSRKVPTL